MTETVRCKNCGCRFPDNPERHKHRQKLCPRCLTPYSEPSSLWKPSVEWLKRKLALRKKRKIEKAQKYFQRARHNLRLEYKREPILQEIAFEALRLELLEKELREKRKLTRRR